jgi:hypothetical protein
VMRPDALYLFFCATLWWGEQDATARRELVRALSDPDPDIAMVAATLTRDLCSEHRGSLLPQHGRCRFSLGKNRSPKQRKLLLSDFTAVEITQADRPTSRIPQLRRSFSC